MGHVAAQSEGVRRSGGGLKRSTQHLGEDLTWCHPAERLSRAGVELSSDGVELEVPADAEMVIEGEISTASRRRLLDRR